MLNLATLHLVSLRPHLRSGCSVVGVLRQIEGRTVKHGSSSGYRRGMADMETHESGTRASFSSRHQRPSLGHLPDRHHGPMVHSVQSWPSPGLFPLQGCNSPTASYTLTSISTRFLENPTSTGSKLVLEFKTRTSQHKSKADFLVRTAALGHTEHLKGSERTGRLAPSLEG